MLAELRVIYARQTQAGLAEENELWRAEIVEMLIGIVGTVAKEKNLLNQNWKCIAI